MGSVVNNDAGCALELAATPAATTGEDAFGSSTSFVNSSFGSFSAELDSAAFDDVDDDDDDDGDNTLHCRTGSAAASDAATDARGVEDRSCLTSKSSSSSSDSSATACTVYLSGCDDIDDEEDDDNDDDDDDLAMAAVAVGKFLSLFEF